MKFRWFVGACLALIAYGTLYSHLPPQLQLFDKSFVASTTSWVEPEPIRAAKSECEQEREREAAIGREIDEFGKHLEESSRAQGFEFKAPKRTPLPPAACVGAE